MRQVTLASAVLALILCTSTANAQTGPQKKGLLGWWHQQSSKYQQNRQRFARKPAQRKAAPVQQQKQPAIAPQQKPAVQNANVVTAGQPQGNVEQTGLWKSKKSWYKHAQPQQRQQTRTVARPAARPTVRPTAPKTIQQPATRRPVQKLQPVAAQSAALRTVPQPPAMQPVPDYISTPQVRQQNSVPVQTATMRRQQVPVHTVAAPVVSHVSSGQPVAYGGYPVAPNYGMYPQTGAAMYPSPVPNVPYQVGGTAITNQAFYPQEMLYPHTHKSMYGPFYYKVRGGWLVTPWGVRSQEQWELMGTEVEVEYRSQISPFAGFTPPGSNRGFSVLDALFKRP